jgi:dihydropyrimidine dehydrogenase (NAD+) subunit PreA
MSELRTEFLGITFPNPFLLGSGPPTANGPMIKEAFDAGWGGAVLKTLALDPTPLPSPRLQVLRRGRELTGMVNIELITEMTLERWESDLDLVRDAHPTRPIIASIMGGNDPGEWQKIIRRFEPRGVDAFELNVSCPNIAEGKGAQLGQDPHSLAKVIGWVKEATHLPIIVKLTPNVTDIVLLARVARVAGADAITATNTLSGLAGIDRETFSPLPAVAGIGIYGGYSGPGLKPVSLRCAASIARAVDVPLIGCGGIAAWQDAVEYVAVGASLVQMCTAAMWRGYGIINKLNRGLEQYLDEHGYESLADIRGKALPNIVTYFDLDLSLRLLAVVDQDECEGCGNCVKACESGGYQAITMDGDVASVSPELCDGCGLCVGVCPEEAIGMVAA